MVETSAIQIGNQTAFSALRPTEPFEYAIANGFDAFEWFPDKKPNGEGWAAQDIDSVSREKIKETAELCSIRLSVHGRWQASPLRLKDFDWLLEDMELAWDLGAAVMNIHLYTEKGASGYARAIQPLLKRAAAVGLRLSIENTPEHTPQHFNELFQALRNQSPNLLDYVGMCLDLGHANLCAATRNDYLKYLAQLDPGVPIIHLHLHENWGDADTHLPLFTGPAGANIAGIRGLVRGIKARGYAGSMILEGWPEPPILLNHAREKLLALLQE